MAALPDSPASYPQQLDLVRAAVLLVGFDEAAYRAASFLDDRILVRSYQGLHAHCGTAGQAGFR